jgi:hypothetical protein
MKKHVTFGIVILLVSFAASAAFGGQPPPQVRGVAGVDVIVKQSPAKRVMTDARGTFAIDALPAGSYTLTFRARKASDKDSKSASDKAVIATSYSIKVDGIKRPVNKAGLTSNDLLAGYDVKVDVGAGAKISGQVAAGALRKMVWIPKEPGSQIPGHWVDADSPEAKAAFHSNAHGMSGDGLRRWMDGASDVHQDGFPTAPVGQKGLDGR